MSKSSTLIVRGLRVSNRSNRRFLVVAIREHVVTTDSGVYPRFARVEKRSDSLTTAKAHARRLGYFPGGGHVVVDSLTGEEV